MMGATVAWCVAVAIWAVVLVVYARWSWINAERAWKLYEGRTLDLRVAVQR